MGITWKENSISGLLCLNCFVEVGAMFYSIPHKLEFLRDKSSFRDAIPGLFRHCGHSC